MRQWRVVGLGNYTEYYSYFLFGIMQGTILNEHLFRAVSLFGQSLNQIYEQIIWFKPHLVLAHMIFNRQPHNINDVMNMLKKVRGHGIKVGYHAGDARPTPRFEGNITNVVDFALCNHNLMDKYSSIWGVPCYYWPYQALNQPGMGDRDDRFKCQVAFTGSLEDNIHHAPRAKFVKSLKGRLNIVNFPTPDSGNTRFQTADLAVTADCVLGFQMGLDIPGYIDVRPWQYIGAGALYFHDEHYTIDKFFIPGSHYIPFKRNDPDDFIAKYIHYVIEHPEEVTEIRTNGFKYCQRYHSSKERMAGVFSLLEGKGYYIYCLNDKKEVIKTPNPWKV